MRGSISFGVRVCCLFEVLVLIFCFLGFYRLFLVRICRFLRLFYVILYLFSFKGIGLLGYVVILGRVWIGRLIGRLKFSVLEGW